MKYNRDRTPVLTIDETVELLRKGAEIRYSIFGNPRFWIPEEGSVRVDAVERLLDYRGKQYYGIEMKVVEEDHFSGRICIKKDNE